MYYSYSFKIFKIIKNDHHQQILMGLLLFTSISINLFITNNYRLFFLFSYLTFLISTQVFGRISAAYILFTLLYCTLLHKSIAIHLQFVYTFIFVFFLIFTIKHFTHWSIFSKTHDQSSIWHRSSFPFARSWKNNKLIYLRVIRFYKLRSVLQVNNPDYLIFSLYTEYQKYCTYMLYVQ